MPEFITWKQFEAYHPYPEQAGKDRLFHLRPIAGVKDCRLEHLFVDGLLFHSAPERLNDPFECKPHYKEPANQAERDILLSHLHKVLLKHGMHADEAMARIVGCIKNPTLLSQLLHQSGLESFAEMRMYSFTASNNNLPMWTHYGALHTGICIEFDATVWPISGARKVKYQKEYPQIAYPPEEDERNMRPGLIKSEAWGYEQEFRHIFFPGAEVIPSNGDSIPLHPETMTGLYFGVNADPDEKDRILKMVEKGPFNPKIYEGALSSTKFKIEFDPMSNRLD
ncbi:DUF2971 domain-containing protein [Marinobacter sp. Arc7-DN-1]|uniref:DUF2971 domain-containing protein n=1 Tax=Marinobacter sp. Arc7-DN-1 TaxID=2304594 RepID=UPI0013C2CA0A|nr:DUF2971 domain-containing protein [Marinobacter sp. Arc7-DN-1]